MVKVNKLSTSPGEFKSEMVQLWAQISEIIFPSGSKRKTVYLFSPA